MGTFLIWLATVWEIVAFGALGGILMTLARVYVRGERRKLSELDRFVRLALKDLPRWCSTCDMSERVCDLHPRTPFETCGCGQGVPRPCPVCQANTYDVANLLEEIARLRAGKGTPAS